MRRFDAVSPASKSIRFEPSRAEPRAALLPAAIVINRKFPTNCCFWPVITVRAYIAIKATAVKYALIYATLQAAR